MVWKQMLALRHEANQRIIRQGGKIPSADELLRDPSLRIRYHQHLRAHLYDMEKEAMLLNLPEELENIRKVVRNSNEAIKKSRDILDRQNITEG